MRLLRSSVLALPALLLTLGTAQAQSDPTGITVTAVPSIGVQGQTLTVTAHLQTGNNVPVSVADGLPVQFTVNGPQTATLKNGIATTATTIACRGTHNCSQYVFASFAGGNGLAPSSSEPYEIAGQQPNFLEGTYVFHLHGSLSSTSSAPAFAVVGTLNFGTTGISGTGVADVNLPTGVLQEIPITATVSYPSNFDGIETLTIQSALGTQQFTLFGDYSEGPQQLANQKARLVEADGNAFSSGELSLQNTSSTGEIGFFVLSGSGESPCPDAACASAAPVFVAGDLGVAYTPGTGYISSQVTVGGAVSPLTTAPATFTTPDSSGRSLITASGSGPSTHFAAWSIDASHLYFISLDPRTQAAVVSGEATSQ